MSHTVCHDAGSWVTSTINQQVTEWIEQDCNPWCLCCNKWLGVLVWIVVTVTKWVVETVCEVVADVIVYGWMTIMGIVDIVVGIFTLDWSRIVGGLGEIFVGLLTLAIDVLIVLTVITLFGLLILNPTLAVIGAIIVAGSITGTFIEEWDTWQLRKFARKKIDDKYMAGDQDVYNAILEALGFTKDTFGLRLECEAVRTFLRSDTKTDGVTPDLIRWERDGDLPVMLKDLAGYTRDANWWDRRRPELVADDGFFSESDLDHYIAQGGEGKDVKQFKLFSMNSGDMNTRLDAALLHASELGLVLKWNVGEQEITNPAHVIMVQNNFGTFVSQPPFSRTHRLTDEDQARAEMKNPLMIGVFGYTSGRYGVSALFGDSTCVSIAAGGTGGPNQRIGVTGASFRTCWPDAVFKYTAIHELGHTFGLCHVNGLTRIMYTNASSQDTSPFSWETIFQLWTQGAEARFIREEAEAVWTYIVDNFSAESLSTRAF